MVRRVNFVYSSFRGRQGFRIKKQYSTGDIDKRGISSLRGSRSNLSSASSESGHSAFTYSHSAGGQGHHTDSNASFVSQDEDITDSNVIETYMGEWKNDKRSGYGECRSIERESFPVQSSVNLTRRNRSHRYRYRGAV